MYRPTVGVACCGGYALPFAKLFIEWEDMRIIMRAAAPRRCPGERAAACARPRVS